MLETSSPSLYPHLDALMGEAAGEQNDTPPLQFATEWKSLFLNPASPLTLRTQLYDAYRLRQETQPEAHTENRAFLREGLQLLKEYVTQQARGFGEVAYLVQTYLQQLPRFREFEVGVIEQYIRDQAQQHKLASAIVESVLSSTLLMVHQHNYVVQFLVKHHLENPTPQDTAELFEAITNHKPYGKIELETRAPQSALRLVLYDDRDYAVLGGGPDNSAGLFLGICAFDFRDLTELVQIQVIAIRGSRAPRPGALYEQVLEHETAHMRMLALEENLQLELLGTSRTHYESPFYDLPIHFVQRSWRSTLNNRWFQTIDNLRNEFQAYTSMGWSPNTTAEILLDSGRKKRPRYVGLYETVADHEFEKKCRQSINAFRHSEPIEVIKELRAALEADLRFIRQQFEKEVARLTYQATELLSFFNGYRGHRGRAPIAGAFLRHGIPDELAYVIRYGKAVQKQAKP